MEFFFTVFYQPIINLLFWGIDLIHTHSLAFGILVLVVVVKVLILPLSVKNIKIQIRIKSISDDLKNIRNNIKDKKEQAEKTIELYKKAGINPITPIFLLLLQIPLFITMFFVIRDVGKEDFSFDHLYSFIPQNIPDFYFLSFNLTDSGSISMSVLVGVTQYILMYYSQKNVAADMISGTQKIFFLVLLPVFAGAVSFFFVTAVGLYWFVNNIISILQEVTVLKFLRIKWNRL